MREEAHSEHIVLGNYNAIADRGGVATVNVTEITYKNVQPRPVDAEKLELARRKLKELPLDGVPDPGPLPEVSLMPFGANPIFVGRGEELKALAENLKGEATSATGPVATTVVTGLGGMGKSQLASEFIHRYGRYFEGGVFWLNFANPATIPLAVAACGGAGGMELRPDFDRLPLQDQMRSVMSAWQSELPRLLVFDNCDDEKLLARWRPRTGGCRVLMTSHRERWHPALGVITLPLGVLGPVEGVALLRKHRSDLPVDDPDLDAIVQELGGLALALELAGSFLANEGFDLTAADYLEQLRRPDLLQQLEDQEVDFSPTDHEQNVARTFMLSYDRLDAATPIGALAVELLARASRFASGVPIDRNLLMATLGQPEEPEEAKLNAAGAVSRLAELGMLRVEEAGALTLHRLLAVFIRGVVNDVEAQPAVEKALLKTADDLRKEYLPVALLRIVLPHLTAVTDVAKVREDPQAASLCTQLGLMLLQTGAFREARTYLERGLAIRKKVLGEEHPDTADSLNALGLLAINQSYSVKEARSLFEKALAIREKALGKEHPLTAESLERYVQAELSPEIDPDLPIYTVFPDRDLRALQERALAIHKKVYGEKHPLTAASLAKLGDLRAAEKKYGEARPLFERALAIIEELYGEGHPETADYLNNLGVLLSKMGKYGEARSLHERALGLRKQEFGEEHLFTSQSYANLAHVLSMQGRNEEARPLFERALAIMEKVAEEGHPIIPMLRKRLAIIDDHLTT